MNSEQIYTINEPDVIFEKFGDEVVVVNMDTGIYYSLRESACEIFMSLKSPVKISEILKIVLSKYEGDINEIASQIHQFINRLISMKLVKISLNASLTKITPSHLSIKSVFLPPKIEIFSDMQDILLLDPVHDVDQSGWPILKDQKVTEGN